MPLITVSVYAKESLHQHVSTPFSFSVNFTCAEAEKDTQKTKSNTYLFILKNTAKTEPRKEGVAYA
jgi:hypothetical protein